MALKGPVLLNPRVPGFPLGWTSSQELFLVTVLPTLLPSLWKLMRYEVQSSESISKEIFNLDVRS